MTKGSKDLCATITPSDNADLNYPAASRVQRENSGRGSVCNIGGARVLASRLVGSLAPPNCATGLANSGSHGNQGRAKHGVIRHCLKSKLNTPGSGKAPRSNSQVSHFFPSVPGAWHLEFILSFGL